MYDEAGTRLIRSEPAPPMPNTQQPRFDRSDSVTDLQTSQFERGAREGDH